MRQPRIRLICPVSLDQSTLRAAASGLKHFERAGVLCESVKVSEEVIKGVKAGPFLLRAVDNTKGIRVTETNFKITLGELLSLHRKDIFGIGITNAPLVQLVNDVDERRVGVSMFNRGALVSLARINIELSGEERENAIKIAIAHEIGHIFRKSSEEHCKTTNCTMQGVDNFTDFVRRLVKPASEFCNSCSEAINVTISSLMHYA
ncbi:MAG: hypothetical protein Q7S22_06360 [Candidatus Micrarchaeota archaeon]|nr:hypothetical protein [Candidatus Micrarchaeota archaeon]